MNPTEEPQENIQANGFTIIDAVFTTPELAKIVSAVNQASQSNANFRKTEDQFAIRQLLKEILVVKQLVFNNKLKSLIQSIFGNDYFVVKSIYFDKPEQSNWFVAWHQDLTISVNKKAEIPGYSSWTVKSNQFAVQPPVNILQDNFTIRIHLDDTDEGNGALKVIPGSHLNGIQRPDNINWHSTVEYTCHVKAGGVMIMKPLIMHASNRTTNNKQRRVIHIEFSKSVLPEAIDWAEMENY